MKLSDFHYDLPDALIARYPAAERTGSRLLVADGSNQTLSHKYFGDLLDMLQAGDLLVFNDTRVLPARLWGRKSTGGKIEILVERVLDSMTVLAHVRASKAPKPGSQLYLQADAGHDAVLAKLEVLGRREALFELRLIESVGESVGEGTSANETEGVQDPADVLELMNSIGHMPLPPYIDREDELDDRSRYQTVYGRIDGAVAAPTAGLHFTEAFIDECESKGVDTAYVTLHVGAGTFQPVRVENIIEHKMHAETIHVSQAVCDQVAATRARGGSVVAVGTTSVRSLESASRTGELKPFSGDSDIFIYPGYRFRSVDAMVTNFHLPESTLIMLVSAFAGKDFVFEAYRQAIAEEYRFFSYGDAMFIKPSVDARLEPVNTDNDE